MSRPAIHRKYHQESYKGFAITVAAIGVRGGQWAMKFEIHGVGGERTDGDNSYSSADDAFKAGVEKAEALIDSRS